MTVVIDASAVASLWLDAEVSRELSLRLAGESLHAPEHLLVEVTNVLRRQRNSGLLAMTTAQSAFAGVMAMPVKLWPFNLLASRVWELGSNASSYDAAYISLAERLGAPLITCDARLSRMPGSLCPIEVF